MNTILSHLIYYTLFLLFSSLGNTDLTAQDWPGRMIHITVSDEEGNPLIGASIVAKGDMVMTLTDENGTLH